MRSAKPDSDVTPERDSTLRFRDALDELVHLLSQPIPLGLGESSNRSEAALQTTYWKSTGTPAVVKDLALSAGTDETFPQETVTDPLFPQPPLAQNSFAFVL